MAGWGLIEVADILTDRGVVPESVFGGALFLLLVGLPVVLATAYVQTPAAEGEPHAEGQSAELDAPPGLARLFTWRNAILGGVAGFALLGLVTAGSALVRVTGLVSPGEGPELQANRVAVLPFGVRGSPELAYLSEGIVDLVSAKLEGAGSFRTVDPRAVLALVPAVRSDAADPDNIYEVARALGAGRFVTGDMLEAAGRLQITAFLHDTSRPDGPKQQASAEGTAAEIFSLLDELVTRLLASSMPGETERLQALATLTSGSLDATKAYLRGEQHLRAGRYRDAAAAYDEAIALDTAFALAYYRKSVAADWIDAFDIRSSAERAAQYSDRLSERDRGLLNALRLRRNASADAEQAFRAQIHVYPDDVEALLQLGEMLFHDIPRQGRSIMEAAAPFRRALALEPTNLIALLHLARLYALDGSTDRLAEVADLVAEIAPESERAVEVEALRAYILGDTERQRAVKESLRGKPWYHWWYAVHSAGRFSRDPRGAEDILKNRESEEPLVEILVPNVQIIQGRYAEAREFLAQPRSPRGDPSWNVFEGFLLTSGAIPPEAERMAELASKLATVEAAELLRTSWLPPYQDRTARYEAFQRDYFRALLLIQLGRSAEARTIIEDLESQDDFVGLGTVKDDAVRSLEAEILLLEGDRSGALEKLRTMEYRSPHALTVTPMPDLSRSRFLRGQLEIEFGDRETARGFLVGLDESWSPWDTYHRPLLYQLMGRMAEDEGQFDQAIEYYTLVIDLWRDADAEIWPVRDEITDRRNALLRQRG